MDETPVEPCRALVRPRIAVAPLGVARLLEEEVQALLAQPAAVSRRLIGAYGSGKTTALRHLAAVFADHPRLRLVDEGMQPPAPAAGAVTIVAVCATAIAPAADTWFVPPWSDDDCLEYLRAAHPHRIAATFAAWLQTGPFQDLRRAPGICRGVLDALATGRATSPFAALRCVLDDLVPEPLRTAARDHALRTFSRAARTPTTHEHDLAADAPAHDGTEPLTRPLSRSLTVRSVLAAERVCLLAADQDVVETPRVHWHSSLLYAVRELLRHDDALRARLVAALEPRRARHRALLLSLLACTGDGFRPPQSPLWGAAGARMPGADLRGMQLLGSLDRIDLTGADLAGAHLVECTLAFASLRRATLTQATLASVQAPHLDGNGLRAAGLVAERALLSDADLRDADLARARLARAVLCRADLTRAVLRAADLQGADLTRARLHETDLTAANLSGADLGQVDLRTASLAGISLVRARALRANLAGVVLVGLDAEGVLLRGADLTGSVLRGASLRRADLRECRLADADWEGADLREVDLRRASFARAEGADAAHEPHAHRPEETRVANLRGCDLRGARLTGADFRLVDVRGAQLDPEQRVWLAQQGAFVDVQATG